MRGAKIGLWYACVGIFGIFVPWYRGLDFFDPLLLVLYFGLSALFVAPIVSDLVSAGVRRTEREILRGVLAGWGSGLLIAGLGFLTLSIGARRLMLPPFSFLGAAAAFSLAASIFAGAASAMIALRVNSAGTARRILRFGFLALLLAVLLVPRLAPRIWARLTHPIVAGETQPLWYITAALAIAAVMLLRAIHSGVRRASAST